MDLTELSIGTKYPPEALAFVQRGLDYTVRQMHGDSPLPDCDDPDYEREVEHRHVTGEQLCWGLRDFAIEQFGLMAQSVLRRWHITSCEDFGHIVFAMVDAQLMRKTDNDTIDDFCGVYDFSDAFAPKLTLTDNG